MDLKCDFRLIRNNFHMDINFKFDDIGVVALFGPSGSGKTTVLRVLAGLEPHTLGTVKINNSSWQDSKNFIPAHLREIGYVFQSGGLFPHLNVEQNLYYAVKRRRKLIQKYSPEQIIELFDLKELLKRDVVKLSGGEKQKVAIARALMSGPSLLLLDEPFAALDDKSKNGLIVFLEKIFKELCIPVIFISHSIDDVARLADKIILMDKGSVSDVGDVDYILHKSSPLIPNPENKRSVIMTQIEGYDDDFHLIRVKLGEDVLFLPGEKLKENENVRIIFNSKDISLTLKRTDQTSILNCIPAIVKNVKSTTASICDVHLAIGDYNVISTISQKSAKSLDLRPGVQVFAQLKCAALYQS